MITVEQARSHYPPSSGSAHGFDHAVRVMELAQRIARAEGADGEIVRTAALLHDLASEGADRDRHHIIGAEQAREILISLDKPADQVEAVVHCIRAHRFRHPEDAPQTLEARCVFDADKLDAIGAVGIARVFVHGAELGHPMWGAVSPEFRAGLDTVEPHTAHHEFCRKLIHIRDQLFTPTGRLMAAERHRIMVDFFERMAREVVGEV